MNSLSSATKCWMKFWLNVQSSWRWFFLNFRFCLHISELQAKKATNTLRHLVWHDRNATPFLACINVFCLREKSHGLAHNFPILDLGFRSHAIGQRSFQYTGFDVMTGQEMITWSLPFFFSSSLLFLLLTSLWYLFCLSVWFYTFLTNWYNFCCWLYKLQRTKARWCFLKA